MRKLSIGVVKFYNNGVVQTVVISTDGFLVLWLFCSNLLIQEVFLD